MWRATSSAGRFGRSLMNACDRRGGRGWGEGGTTTCQEGVLVGGFELIARTAQATRRRTAADVTPQQSSEQPKKMQKRLAQAAQGAKNLGRAADEAASRRRASNESLSTAANDGLEANASLRTWSVDA